MIFTMTSAPFNASDVPGTCAKCKAQVYASLFTLDDAWAVWCGKCPHCEALNLLSTKHGLRGYFSQQMFLVLPTAEEVAQNGLPADTPTQGVKP